MESAATAAGAYANWPLSRRDSCFASSDLGDGESVGLHCLSHSSLPLGEGGLFFKYFHCSRQLRFASDVAAIALWRSGDY